LTPNCEIKIERDYEGPSIVEIESIIDNITEEPIKVAWGNTRDEINALHRFPKRQFLLHVQDFPARDRTTSVLGLPLRLESTVVERSKLLLTDLKAADWRTFCKEQESQHGVSTKYALLKLVADALRKGKTPALAEIVGHLFLSGIDIKDVDILLRLKSGAIR